MKIIQVNSFSTSLIMKDFDEDIFRNWPAKVAFEIKKKHPKFDVECWTLERRCKKEKEITRNRVKFRIFPSEISVRHGMEISLKMLKALREEQKKIGDEKLIIHFHGYHMWQVYLMLFYLDKQRDIKVIAQHHGDRGPLKNLRKYKRMAVFLPGIILMQFFENFLFREVDCFYYLSDEEGEYLEEIAPKSEIKFQTMGIGEENFKKIDKMKARQELDLDKNKKYLLYLGRIERSKGIKELLEVMREVGDDRIDLLVIGEGRYRGEAERNSNKNIKFLGAIYGKKKLLYLSAVDCLILPSHTEGAPVVLMEAIAKNVPVIATKVGGIPKMIKTGREGILINPYSSKEIKEAIEEILKWKKKNIKKYAEKYRWEKIIDATVKDYMKK